MSATTSSKPGGVRAGRSPRRRRPAWERKGSWSPWRSPLSLLLERNGGRHARHVAVHLGRMALARGVLDQTSVTRAENVLGAVAQPDLELAGEDDHELPPRCRVPVLEVPRRALPEGDLRGGEALGPIGSLGEGNWLDVGLAVVAGVESEQGHGDPPRVGVKNDGIVARGRSMETRLEDLAQARYSSFLYALRGLRGGSQAGAQPDRRISRELRDGGRRGGPGARLYLAR